MESEVREIVTRLKGQDFLKFCRQNLQLTDQEILAVKLRGLNEEEKYQLVLNSSQKEKLKHADVYKIIDDDKAWRHFIACSILYIMSAIAFAGVAISPQVQECVLTVWCSRQKDNEKAIEELYWMVDEYLTEQHHKQNRLPKDHDGGVFRGGGLAVDSVLNDMDAAS